MSGCDTLWPVGSPCQAYDGWKVLTDVSPAPSSLVNRYPAFAGGLLSNWQLVEGMKESCCYQAQDYGGLLQKAMAEPATAGGEC
jgi:hypothetical protein